MNNFSDIKKRLSMSTTMPIGTGGNSGGWLMGSAHKHSHTHNHDGSCCSHDHSHDDSHEHDDECCEDNTNPTGGCC